VSAAEQRPERVERPATSRPKPVRPAPCAVRYAAPARRRTGSRLFSLLRPLPLILIAVALPQRGRPVPLEATAEPDLASALARALSARSLEARPGEVFWVDAPAGLLGSRQHEPRALLRARRQDEPADIYLATSRLSPEGRLLEVTGLYNLSDTSAVDERQLTVAGQRAAWVIGGGGKIYSVQYANLRGELTPADPSWSRTAQWQNRLTNWQNTGQLEGIGRRSFRLDPAAATVALAFSDTALLVEADSRRIRIGTDAAGQIEGERFIREQVHYKAAPGNLVTWAVDRVRAIPWFGSDRMQLVKAVAFAALDKLQQVVGTVTGDDGSDRIAEELGELMDAPPVTYSDPETGWPPPPMQPPLVPPLQGEGQWRALDQDPFVRTNPGAPAPFVTSFIRTDKKRAHSQIFVTLWDPRQVQLHAMSGTVEPKSATGETGPGLVPRRPEVMGRLLAGLNGGFQATHGEWGMMAEGIIYLPPKPYAATVAELRDGSTAFGTWPDDERVPDNIVSFRQNMTPLVMDGVINPYRRTWWGGVPPGWEDESRTVRSGICLTQEGFVAYLYGTSIDADQLTLAMQQARCSYGIHLDMNPGHTGLEFYQAGPESELPPLSRPLDGRWEAEGPVEGMPGWRFRGRRMIRYMGLMNFPRYINRESRDFFYLTLRHVLPGANLQAPLAKHGDEEGKWKVEGLPQHGWPYSIATTWVRPDPRRRETKVRVLKLDPTTVRVSAPGASARQTVVTLNPAAADDRSRPSLWLDGGRLYIGTEPPTSAAHRLAAGYPPDDPQAARAVAAVGIVEGGMLAYAEVTTAPRPGHDHHLLGKLLDQLGCESRLLLTDSPQIALGGNRDLSGHPVARREQAIELVRTEAPGARRIFKDTPIVESDVWYPLQARRVRYFRKPKRDQEQAEQDDQDATAEPPAAVDSTDSAGSDETGAATQPAAPSDAPAPAPE
jgi:hypothetical protein